MDTEAQIKRMIEDFKREAGIDENLNNQIAFMHLTDDMVKLVSDSEHAVVTDDCNCGCDECENCFYK